MSTSPNAWADIHARTVGETRVIPRTDGDPFVTAKLDAGVYISLRCGDTRGSMELSGGATLYLSIPAARELAHALLAATEPAPALSEVA
jgi:hypothetical protein